MHLPLVSRLFACVVLTASLAHAQNLKMALNLPSSSTWFATEPAAQLARSILQYQTPEGGWPKNTDMSKPPSDELKARIASTPSTIATIDNGGTTEPLILLARVITARRDETLEKAFLRGINYLLEAQYANGGWPQFYPLRKGYYTHITFNDNAMVRVLRLLKDLSQGKAPYAWVSPELRSRAALAVEKGIDCILRCQIVVEGVKTGWCAQHDEVTFAPAKARAYEHPSLSGAEAVGIVEFLMCLETPSPAVIEAVESAVAWFERVKITGMAVRTVPDPRGPKGFDRVLVPDPEAKPLWARFYEIGTNRPMFSGRDSVIHYKLEEIEIGRRTGYSWFSDTANDLLSNHYPKWKKRLSSTQAKRQSNTETP